MGSKNAMVISASPHIYNDQSTASLVWSVIGCLVPAGVWGAYVYGFGSLFVLAVAIGASVMAELAMGLAFRRFTLADGTAVLTGLLIGYGMPPAVPWYIPASAAVFAIVVVKWTFGGLGSNWMNPALAGRVFASLSWGDAMTSWVIPKTLTGVEGVSGATPLGFIKSALTDASGVGSPMEILKVNGYIQSGADSGVTGWLNANLLNPLGIQLPGGYFDLFAGNVPGCIGEISAILLLLGAVYLIARDVIAWEIPAAYIGSFIVLVWAFGGMRFGSGLGEGDALFALFSGGLILTAFFMATDPVTSPLGRRGLWIFGIGCGLLTFLIRYYGSFPEGAAFAVLIMNIFVPIIDKATKPTRLSQTSRGIRDRNAASPDPASVKPAVGIHAAGTGGAR
jgi:Na+-translocating ferredoxin:NAD+ oxidoreductase subunit D